MVTARSAQNQPLKDDQKKPFVGSRVKELWSRGGAFMPPCEWAQNRAVTDLQPPVKGASNFDGFMTKNTNQKANRMSRKASQQVDEPSPGSSSSPSGSTAALLHAGGQAWQPCGRGRKAHLHAMLPSHNSHDNTSAISPAVPGDATEDEVHKLRLKLLKKLKAKKKKLAALLSSPNCGTCVSDQSELVSLCGSPNGNTIEVHRRSAT
ncbi:SUMO-specific isopeptidase USPL1 [Lemmus lemmus]